MYVIRIIYVNMSYADIPVEYVIFNWFSWAIIKSKLSWILHMNEFSNRSTFVLGLLVVFGNV